MKAFATRLATTSEVIAAVLTAAIIAVMLAQIWFRYVLNDSLLWSEEICTWGLLWVVFLGAAAVIRDWGHVNVPLFVNSLPPRARAVAMILAKILVLGFLVFLTWLGFDAFGQSYHRVSPMLGLSTKWAKLAIPVGGLLMTILTVTAIAEDLRRLFAQNGQGPANGARPDRTR